MGHQFPTMQAGARAQVDHIISTADGFFVVFHHQHGVSQVAQRLQCLQKPIVVAVMKADRGLIKHVENAAQLRTNLSREPDTLALAAG